MAKWAQGTVVENHHWAGELYSLRVEADLDNFTAGQFTRLALEIDGELIARPYSFVNSPGERPHEFYFITVPQGPLTDVLPTLKAGDPILVQPKAAGFFTLKEVPDSRDLWMLSTGTAIGPFLSILGTDEPWDRFENIILVHAVRTAAELSFQNRIAELLENWPDRLQMIPFVSREQADGAMHGRVTTAIEDGTLEARADLELSPDNSQVMICGNPAMVSDTSELLQARGLTKNRRREPGHITTENYWKPDT